MTLQKPAKYQAYPRSVQKGGENGLRKRVDSAEEEAAFLEIDIEQINAKNEKRKLSTSERLRVAEELALEGQSKLDAAEDILAQAQKLKDDAAADLKKSQALKDGETGKGGEENKTTEETKGEGEKDPVVVNSSADVPEGDKDALEKYAKEKFGIDLDKRKGFDTLLEQVKQEEAKNA